jgi:phage terminase Nu1 subunit (DNA packaging protein)
MGSALDTVHVKVKRKCPDIEVRHVDAVQHVVAVTRNELVKLADKIPEYLDEFVQSVDDGAD